MILGPFSGGFFWGYPSYISLGSTWPLTNPSFPWGVQVLPQKLTHLHASSTDCSTPNLLFLLSWGRKTDDLSLVKT